MPTRKQRRRELKAKRHDYEIVYLDADGNELDEPPPELLEAEAKKRERANGAKAAPAKQQGRQSPRNRREPQPPSWLRAAKRSALLGIFFVVILSLGARGNRVIPLVEAVVFAALYVPMMYGMDRWIYRRYQAKRAAAGGGSTPRPAKKR